MYFEPFFGSGAVLLQRPGYNQKVHIETINDKCAFICNVWRALQFNPDEVAKWCDWPVNHCFPAGVKIETPNGNIEIQKLRKGDYVLGFSDGRIVQTKIIGLSCRTVLRSDVICIGVLSVTKNHPIWTEQGYEKAKNVLDNKQVGMVISRYESKNAKRTVKMRTLWNFFSGQSPTQKVLLKKLRLSSCKGKDEEQSDVATKIKTVATQSSKPDIRSDYTAKEYDIIKRTKIGLAQGEKMPSRFNVGAKATFRKIELADRGSGKNKYSSRAFPIPQGESNSSIQISNGHSRVNIKDRCGSGRKQSPQRGAKGLQTRCVSDIAGMDGASFQKQSSIEQYGRGCSDNNGDCQVYNIQTESGNYFAGRVLVHNCDLSARKAKLIENENHLLENLISNPEWYDAKMAGYWIWAASCWIGSGLTSAGQIPRLTGGQGVHKTSKIPHLTHGGNEVQEPYNVNIYTWFRKLSERLRYVRVVCGEWTRICNGDWQDGKGIAGFFLDPPYGVTDRDTSIYRHDSTDIAKDVLEWCKNRGQRASYRIVLAGYNEYQVLIDNYGWRSEKWKAGGGYGNRNKDNKNRHRETLYFSPHCVTNTLWKQ